jgi:hypothetical protein
VRLKSKRPSNRGSTCPDYKKIKIMATVYKVEVVSHWISYSKEELELILTDAVNKIESEKGNTIKIKIN